MSLIQRLMAILLPCGLLAAAPALAARPVADPAAVEQPQVDVMVKTPYLIYPGVVGQMEVLWQLSGSYTSTIDWGTDLTYASGSASSVEYGTGNQHAYTITGLLPATRYYYRVTTFGVSYTGTFLSAPAADATQLKFLSYGDTRSNPSQHDQEAAALRSVITADPAYQALTLFMGDYVLNGCTESYWSSEWFSPLYPNIRALTAILPYAGCMGNHETYPAGQTLFPKYFPYPFAGSRYYYSFDYGPAHFTVLDVYTAFDSNSVQGQWFRADLAASTKTWKFVVLHEPGWSASNTCGNGHTNNVTVQTQVEPFCERYGVAVVFAGHNHYYARAVVNGIQHVTDGGGGAPLNTGCTGQPNEVAYLADYHFCKIAIDGGVLQYQAINRDTRAVIDSFTLVRAMPDVTPPSVAVTAPLGGEDWKAGSSHAITWTATDDVGVTAVDLDYSTDGGAGFTHPIASGLANSGTYLWTVPDAPGATTQVRVRAHDAAGHAAADASPGDFTISRWIITASAGAGGSVVPSGDVPVIEGASRHFSIAPAPGYQVATLTVDGGAVAPDTTYTFANVAAMHTLVATFTDGVAPSVVVTAPVGGERWDQGSVQTVTWIASDNVGVDSIDVDCSFSGTGGPWWAVAHGLANSGSYAWTLPMQPSDSALVRVTAYDRERNARSARSDSLFHIVDPTASVSPGGPAVLALARPQPNPSRGTTLLAFSLPEAGSARLEIVDLSGRRVWQLDGVFPAGTQRWLWDGATSSGERAGAGLYFVRLSTPWGERIARLVRLR